MTVTTTERLVPTGTWAIDDPHSSAGFEAEHAGVSVFRGGFKPIDAKLVSGDDGVELEGTVQVEAISVDDENIRPHLLSPDFFDVGRNPEIKFRSTAIDGTPDDLRIRGDLSMAGFTLPVEATGRLRGPVTLGEGIERLSLSLETTVDRTAFGMTWQMELPDGNQALGNDVRLVVELEFQKS